mmetsp:Transcript_51352/g.111975  ORF Transcript_51352/g.111975 Transcript_51352/m.111975 type:complete len:265 (-) Transcript_51352:137-931(-)
MAMAALSSEISALATVSVFFMKSTISEISFTFSACFSSASLWAWTISAISLSSLVMVSVCSSMVRANTWASFVSSARSCSHVSLASRSSASSVSSVEIILSMAEITSSKWLPEVAAVAARARSLASPDRRLASLSVATADFCWCALAVPMVSWTKEAPRSWDAKDFLKRSRLSSLCRMEIALLMAASSPERSAWRTFHSSFLAVRADCTCVMYFLSFVTWSSRVSFSSTDCSRDMPLAPPSLLMSLREVLAVSSSSFLDSISLL